MRCINTTGCLTAYRREEIHPKPGGPSVCPECGTTLSSSPLASGMAVKIVALVALAAALGAAGYFGRPYAANLLHRISMPRPEAVPTAAPAVIAALGPADPAAAKPAPTPIPPVPTPTPPSVTASATPAPQAETVVAVTASPRREPEPATDASASSADAVAAPQVRVREGDANSGRGGLPKGLTIIRLPPLATPVSIVRDPQPQVSEPRRMVRSDASAPPPLATPRARVKVEGDQTPIRLDSAGRIIN